MPVACLCAFFTLRTNTCDLHFTCFVTIPFCLLFPAPSLSLRFRWLAQGTLVKICTIFMQFLSLLFFAYC